MLAIIDGDAILYKAGFAIEKYEYFFRHDSGETGFFEPGLRLERIKEIARTLRPGKLVRALKVEPAHHAFYLAKLLVNKILAEVTHDRYVVVLGNGLPNFRHQIATTKPYKGHRARRPKYLKEIKEYVTKTFNAEITPAGLEADDWIGILSQQQPSTICGIDKDLRMLPGMHYNIDSGEYTESSDPGYLFLSEDRKKIYGYGKLWFWAQCLLGDSADNIPGLPGYGIVKTYNTLKETKCPLHEVVKAYDLAALDRLRLYEVMKLLWIHRQVDDSFLEAAIKCIRYSKCQLVNNL